MAVEDLDMKGSNAYLLELSYPPTPTLFIINILRRMYSAC